MTFTLARAAALAVIAAPLFATAPAAAQDFPTVVRSILDNQTDGPLTEMSGEQRAAMTDCVITTLDALPNGKKRLIVEAGDLSAQEDQFGKIVDENRAEWRKKIAGACAEIAMNKDAAAPAN